MRVIIRISLIILIICCGLIGATLLFAHFILPINTLQFYTFDRSGTHAYLYDVQQELFSLFESQVVLGYRSPDGQRIAYLEGVSTPALFVANPDGTQPRVVGVYDIHSPFQSLIWRDNQTVLLIDGDIATRVLSVDIETGDMATVYEQLSHIDGYFYMPQRNTLLMQTFDSTQQLHLINLADGAVEVMPNVGLFQLSDDNTRLVYTGFDDQKLLEIEPLFVRDMTNGTTTALDPPDAVKIVSIGLTPDPDVVYLSLRNPDVTYVASVSENTFTALIDASLLFLGASPDGRYLLAVDTAQGFGQNVQLEYTMLDTVQQHVAYTFKAESRFLPNSTGWSPDSQRLALLYNSGIGIVLDVRRTVDGQLLNQQHVFLQQAILPDYISSSEPLSWWRPQ